VPDQRGRRGGQGGARARPRRDLNRRSSARLISAADDLALEQAAVELRAVLAALYRRIRQTKELGELTGPEGSSLSRLSHHGAMTAAELAKLEQISPQSIANTLQGLLATGLLQRSAD